MLVPARNLRPPVVEARCRAPADDHELQPAGVAYSAILWFIQTQDTWAIRLRRNARQLVAADALEHRITLGSQTSRFNPIANCRTCRGLP
jgi:hypothetical protein